MTEVLTRRRNGAAKYLPVVSRATEASVIDVVLCAARFVHNPAPEHFVELERAVKRMGTKQRRKNEYKTYYANDADR